MASLVGPVLGSGGGVYAAHTHLTRFAKRHRDIEDEQSYKRIRLQGPDSKDGVGMVRQVVRRTRLSRRKRQRRRRPYRRVPRTVQPFSVLRTMKTVYNNSLNPGAGSLDYDYFQLNSGYDPTQTLSTQQPLGWDQMTALYNKYCVISWSAKIECVTTDNTATVATVIGFTPMTQSGNLTSFNHYKECPGTTSAITTPDMDRVTFFARGGVKKWFLPPGGKLLSNENLVSAVGGSPTNLLFGHLWAQAIDGASDPGAVNYIITIWQKIVFFDPVIPARS